MIYEDLHGKAPVNGNVAQITKNKTRGMFGGDLAKNAILLKDNEKSRQGRESGVFFAREGDQSR